MEEGADEDTWEVDVAEAVVAVAAEEEGEEADPILPRPRSLVALLPFLVPRLLLIK